MPARLVASPARVAMPGLSRPAVRLAVALALTTALALTACSGAAPAESATAAPAAVGTSPGAVLAYHVQASGQAYPFVVSVRQNDADGIAFGFDLGDGSRVGTVQMSPAAVESAHRMQNTFGATDYRLSDKTSVWLARELFARLRRGEAVALNLAGGPDDEDFAGGCGETFSVGTAGGASYAVPACRFSAGDQSLVVADDLRQPLILSMDTGLFRVELQTAMPAGR